MIPFELFSPSDAPFRSAAIALTALLMVFAPSYPVVQWLRGYPLPAKASLAGIIVRYLAVFILFAWFAWIWKAGKLLEDVLDHEIDTLDNEVRSQCSR